MFKNYLTYNFALSFERSCRAIMKNRAEIPVFTADRLNQSLNQMVFGLTQSLQTTDRKAELRFVCSSLINLRDCKDILIEAKLFDGETKQVYTVLCGRLERICSIKALDAGGQLQLFA